MTRPKRGTQHSGMVAATMGEGAGQQRTAVQRSQRLAQDTCQTMHLQLDVVPSVAAAPFVSTLGLA